MTLTLVDLPKDQDDFLFRHDQQILQVKYLFLLFLIKKPVNARTRLYLKQKNHFNFPGYKFSLKVNKHIIDKFWN